MYSSPYSAAKFLEHPAGRWCIGSKAKPGSFILPGTFGSLSAARQALARAMGLTDKRSTLSGYYARRDHYKPFLAR